MKKLIDMLAGLNAMSLALGVIIGGAIGKVVSSLTGDVLMPIISLVIPGGAWREAQIALTHTADGKVEKAISIGAFAGAIVDFLIIAIVIGWLTKMLIKPAPPGPATKDCPECKETILAAAKKCKYCSSPA